MIRSSWCVAMLIWTYLVAVVASVPAGQRLTTLHIEKGSVTAVAFDQPTDLAHQLHIGHASLFSGSCLFAVQRYHCAATNFSHDSVEAWSPCTRSPHCDGCIPVLPFDHCKRTSDDVDVGSLVDYPRRHCGQAQSASTRVRTCKQPRTRARMPACAQSPIMRIERIDDVDLIKPLRVFCNSQDSEYRHGAVENTLALLSHKCTGHSYIGHNYIGAVKNTLALYWV